MISRLTAPGSDIDGALRELYKKVNELVEAINASGAWNASSTNQEHRNLSKETMRVEEQPDGQVRVLLKTSKGWAESDSSESSGFKLKEL